MNLLNTSSRWPIYMAIIGLGIVVASVWYTNRLAGKLSQTEENYVRLFEQAMEDISNVATEEDLQKSMTIQLEILERMETVPQNFDHPAGRVRRCHQFWGQGQGHGLHHEPVADHDRQWKASGGAGLPVDVLWTKPVVDSAAIFSPHPTDAHRHLHLPGLPRHQSGPEGRTKPGVGSGMAKETAHQLGTPISAIMGWLEHIKLMYEDQPDILEVSEEMGKDVERLSMVANRFSKIGAAPELEPVNVFAELDKCREYMEKRAPRKVSFDFPAPEDGDIRAAINPLLFDWVIENLLRNALDAMDGKGTISGSVRELEDKVYIDISDTGKGIAAKNIRKVFNPGFTTKKRGWGLGLSLVKRIVEQYHRGKIAVTASEVGKGTTFTITLPRA
jgi:hypothetical protein